MTALTLPAALARRLVLIALTAFVVTAVALGGAPGGYAWMHASIQIFAVLLFILAIWTPDGNAAAAAQGRPLLLCAAALLGFGLFQLTPMPGSVWSNLPGRADIAEGFRALGANLPPMPISLTPEATRQDLLALLAPLAAFILAARLSLRSDGMVIAATLAGLATMSFLLGIVQMEGGLSSPLYVFKSQNRGWPTGVFANINHQATLLLIALPFLGALVGNLRFRSAIIQSEHGKLALTIAVTLVIVAGVVLCGSIAGYLMLGPVVMISLLLAAGHFLRPGRSLWFGLAVAVLIVLGAVGANFVVDNNLTPEPSLFEGPSARPELFARTAEAAVQLMPFGAGLGSFMEVYPSFENPDVVTYIYAPHTHNEYLQIAFELGVIGIAIVSAAIFWWVTHTVSIWRMPLSTANRIRRAASIAIGIVLVHSLVDFPARTLAIATLVGLCAGLMIAPDDTTKLAAQDQTSPKRRRTIDL